MAKTYSFGPAPSVAVDKVISDAVDALAFATDGPIQIVADPAVPRDRAFLVTPLSDEEEREAAGMGFLGRLEYMAKIGKFAVIMNIGNKP